MIKAFILFFLLVISTLAARAGIEYTPYILPNLLQLHSVSRYLETTLNGQTLVKNAFTKQMMDHFLRIHPETYGFTFYDFLKNLNEEEAFKMFLNKNEPYREYVQWMEYRLTQSLLKTLELIPDYSQSELDLSELLENDKNTIGNFQQWADSLTTFEITESYEQMMNHTSYRFKSSLQGLYLTTADMLAGILPQLKKIIDARVIDKEEMSDFNKRISQMFDLERKVPRTRLVSESINKAMYLADLEITKDYFRIAGGFKDELTMDNCNLFFTDFGVKSQLGAKSDLASPKRDYSLPPLGEN